LLIPVRCFSCGFPVAEYYETYKDLLSKGKSQKDSLDGLNIKRYCCRRMMISNYDYVYDNLKYQK